MTAIGAAQLPTSADYWRGRYERQATELERATQRIDDLERNEREGWDAAVTQVWSRVAATMDQLRGELLKVRCENAELRNTQAYVHAAQKQCEYAWWSKTVDEESATGTVGELIHCDLLAGHESLHEHEGVVAPSQGG